MKARSELGALLEQAIINRGVCEEVPMPAYGESVFNGAPLWEDVGRPVGAAFSEVADKLLSLTEEEAKELPERIQKIRADLGAKDS